MVRSHPAKYFFCRQITQEYQDFIQMSSFNDSMKKIVIVGGGLAGLVAAIHITRSGVPVTVIEKKSYPFHRVCGEYISNEVVPYLKSLGLYPGQFGLSSINQLQITSVNGRAAFMPLDLGGFGISRYQFDFFLYQQAVESGVTFMLNSEVEECSFQDDHFLLKTSGDQLEADIVVGSFGKRSRLDVQLQRSFIRKRSPYVGVKYHIRLKEFPANLIALHNFSNGYCGISRVEDNRVNLCYLTHRDNLKDHGQIKNMEEKVLFRNPFIRSIFESAEFLFDKPETINEISFETKSPVVDHILMAGDSAGMITPLCGNGMAIAIHSASLLSPLVVRFAQGHCSRKEIESAYSHTWHQQFSRRLWTGRLIQRLFGKEWTSNFAVNLAAYGQPVAAFLVRKTHGKPF